MTHALANVILAIDPGQGTGIAWASADWRKGDPMEWTEVYEKPNTFYDEPYVYAIMQVMGHIQKTRASIVVIEDNAALVVSPAMRGRLTKDSLIPVRMEAMLSFMLAQKWSPIEIRRQGPSDKTVMTNARLKSLGVDPGAKLRHARDAVRHLLIAIDRNRKASRRRTR